jgi:hypothetical protein
MWPNDKASCSASENIARPEPTLECDRNQCIVLTLTRVSLGGAVPPSEM